MKRIKLKINFKDKRGSIKDIFYKKNINHIAVIKSAKGALRGDHFHKKTVQYMYITKGELEYWYKNRFSKGKSKMALLKEGDLIMTPRNEMHALKITKNNEFIVFTTGLRGGKDYETDTFRFKPTIIKN